MRAIRCFSETLALNVLASGSKFERTSLLVVYLEEMYDVTPGCGLLLEVTYIPHAEKITNPRRII